MKRQSRVATARSTSARILFRITAWDANCPQHIPQRFAAEDVAVALARKDARIAELEAELARARRSGE